MKTVPQTPEQEAAYKAVLAARPASSSENATADDPKSDNGTIQRLATLSPLDYDRLRESEAERLGVRVATLDKLVAKARATDADDDAGSAVLFDEVEAWHETVNGVELLSDLAATVLRFSIVPKHTDTLVALWIAKTYLMDVVDTSPILAITSPEKRCGKSTLLNTLLELVNRPLLASNITPSAIFRSVEYWKPTLILDEADTFIKGDNEELRGILNCGHTRHTAFIIRTVGDDHEPRRFSTWAAKAIAGIGHLPDTLKDRSLIVELRRKRKGERVERMRYANDDDFLILRRKCQRFADDNRMAIMRARPELPNELNDRAADNWEPLLAIAGIAGGAWPKLALDAALSLAGVEKEAVSANVELLMDIRDIFDTRKVDRISTVDLIEALCDDDEKPWSTWNRGKPISPHQLSKRVREFGAIPSAHRFYGGKVAKGYSKDALIDAFARYIPSETVTPLQPNNDGLSSGFQDSYKDKMLPIEKPLEAPPIKACNGVTVSEGVKGANDAQEVVFKDVGNGLVEVEI